jgi:cytochrome c oxidase subunit 2
MTLRILRDLFCAGLILTLTGCTGEQSALDVHGAPAIGVYHLIMLIIVVCTAVWMLVVAMLLLAIWRRRARPDDPLLRDPGTERRMGVIIAGAVIATVIIICGFTVASFFTTRAISLATGDALSIRVRGLQWWWEVTYLDAGPNLTLTTANEIHIPVGRNVRLELESADVIHSFWVPSLAGKQDLIPGRHNELTIRAERPGVYRGQCAEFCGLQHAHMALLVVAEDPADFANWVSAQNRQAARPTEAEVATGQQLFLSKPCAACHAVRGTSADGKTGPDLTHVGSRRTIAAGLFDTTRGSLAAWIADPQTLKPGNNMPMVPLSGDELRSISAYMASLK